MTVTQSAAILISKDGTESEWEKMTNIWRYLMEQFVISMFDQNI